MLQAYGSGCDVVILASDFECVQIIPGAQNGNIQVGCVECSHQLGRVSSDCTVGHTPTPGICFVFSGPRDFFFLTVCIKKTNERFIYCCPDSATITLPLQPLPALREWLCCTDGVTNIRMMNADFFFNLFLDCCILRKHSVHL